MSVGVATGTWPVRETNPERTAILAAADRLLSGAPSTSTGNLSVVQLAIEARVKYWVVAQRHTDLRDHFQQLAATLRNSAAASHSTSDDRKELKAERDRLRQPCGGLEQVVNTHATIINELSLDNEALRAQLALPASNVTPLRSHRGGPQ